MHNHYRETLTYADARGNIASLQRQGTYLSGSSYLPALIDNLAYSYIPGTNKLKRVTDSAPNTTARAQGFKPGTLTTDRGYDANGNMTFDPDKNLNLTYNHLNKPTLATFNGTSPLKTIEWVYDASGNKLKKVVKSGGTVQYTQHYSSGIEYRQGATGAPVIEAIYHPEGRVYNTNVMTINPSVVWRYEYSIRDHLGNTRITFSDLNGNNKVDVSSSATTNEVLQENHYYPFGLGTNGAWMNSATSLDNLYQYNGKELNADWGLNMLDYGARMYMADVGRWNGVDAMATGRQWVSPYNYVQNNPFARIDPDGNLDDWVQRSNGSIYWDKNANSQSSTKQGEAYLGKELKFTFNSYIDKDMWDGPLGDVTAGDKLTSTVTVKGEENNEGELTSITSTVNVDIGNTPVGSARNYYPGEGGANNLFSVEGTSTGTSINLEQHASVSPIEEFGINLMGYKIVDVAQKLTINYDKRDGELSVSASTGVFPSASLSVNGNKIMQYDQPSFVETHTAPVIYRSTARPNSINPLTPPPVRDFSYYPSQFFKRL